MTKWSDSVAAEEILTPLVPQNIWFFERWLVEMLYSDHRWELNMTTKPLQHPLKATVFIATILMILLFLEQN